MGVLKNEELKIEKYQFGNLVPSTNEEIDNEEYDFASLDNASAFKNNLTDESIRVEREMEAKAGFNILDLIKESRGLSKQAEEDFVRRVNQEVEAKLSKVRQEAYDEGFQRGQEDGVSKAYAEAKEESEVLVEKIESEIVNLKVKMQDIYEDSKTDAYRMIKNLTKWIILKEVDEKYYLARLLEKLIYEINLKSNLVIHVNESAFGHMPEIIKIVERKIGKLTNTRVEVDLDMTENGIKLEAENTIIDGSLDAQFETIDRLFENVGVNER